MFETEKYNQETCLIVHPDLKHIPSLKQSLDQDRAVAEIDGLVRAIHLEVVCTHIVKPKKLYAGAFLGRGQRDDIAALVEEFEPDLVVVNSTLSPVQQRNLERDWRVKVIDRTGLILEIFGERAQTKEGKLQVDLAMLEYQKSRLVRSWTHLERQRGGAGFMGGPGETQIEIDRRLIAERIVKLKREIEAVSKMRDLGRQARDRVPFPIVALVGYTNAGKSTLFNRLTGANVMAEDLLFATLDPTMRKVQLEGGQDVILADTVGFISDLPTHLVAAFRSTLEQVSYADVILHVIDASNESYQQQRRDVIEIMKDLGVEYDVDPRIIEVWNKLDIAPDDVRADALRFEELQQIERVGVSAVTGDGVDVLLKRVEDIISRDTVVSSVSVPMTDGKAIAWIHGHSRVLEVRERGGAMDFKIVIDDARKGQFAQMFDYDLAS